MYASPHPPPPPASRLWIEGGVSRLWGLCVIRFEKDGLLKFGVNWGVESGAKLDGRSVLPTAPRHIQSRWVHRRSHRVGFWTGPLIQRRKAPKSTKPAIVCAPIVHGIMQGEVSHLSACPAPVITNISGTVVAFHLVVVRFSVEI